MANRIELKQLIKLHGLDSAITIMGGLTLAAIIDNYTDRNLTYDSYLAITGGLWLLRTIPNANSLTLQASRQYMGLKEKQLVKAKPSRAARLRTTDRDETIFFNRVGSIFSKSSPAPAPELPDLFLVENVTIGNNILFDYELVAHDVDLFIVTAANRAFYFQPPFSRPFWLGEKHWKKRKYYAALKLLVDTGLLINRGQGASGELVLPPSRAKHHVRWAYALTH